MYAEVEYSDDLMWSMVSWDAFKNIDNKYKGSIMEKYPWSSFGSSMMDNSLLTDLLPMIVVVNKNFSGWHYRETSCNRGFLRGVWTIFLIILV